ncbi:MAG: DUF5615 family PIN-like protein [Candidatus Gracilibacteria bacterium]
MFKFLIDHNVPKSVSDFLRKQKYNVKLVKDVNAAMTDLQVLNLAVGEGRIIVSNDKDFISLSVRYSSVDMILFSYLNQSAEMRISGLRRILSKLKVGFGVVVLQ